MIKISKETQDAAIQYSKYVMTEQAKSSSYYDKMEAVDTAYACYTLNKDPKTGIVRGEGIDAATTPVGVFNVPSTTPPVIVSQVDSMVGYLSEVFLSGAPLFPIVSSPANRNDAEALEALLDDHSTLGGYPRELLIFFRNIVKYNLGAVEADWNSVDQYDVMDELIAPEQPQLKKNKASFTKLTCLDMYNTIWDRNTDPGSISRDGDYAGYVKILSRIKLRRLLNKLKAEEAVLNANEALKSYITSDSNYYRIHPQVSDYVESRKPESTINWEVFLGATAKENDSQLVGNYELLTLYARLCPEDLGISSPVKDVPQIFKIQIINGDVVICVKRVISAYDLLPILFGQPIEDGLGYQTKSIAEAAIPIQTAAKTLFAINFNSARRAVSDRALYNPTVINPKDVNSPVPAAKIPVNVNLLGARPISDNYYPIPFDGRGTESALRDGMQIIEFGKTLSGLNAPMQGQFQKGNKSVAEWRDTMGSADSRLRLQALSIEYQFFVPLKAILKFNIWQYGQDVAVISQKTGDVINVDIAKMRQSVMSFRVADGFIPKSKLASTEAIIQVMQMISQSPILQQRYGLALPEIVAHLAQLMGVHGMNEYAQHPQQSQQDLLSAPGPDFVANAQKRDLTQQELALREQSNQLRAQEIALR